MYIVRQIINKEELIRQIQEYADGVYIYIPGKRHARGQEPPYKAELQARNAHIRRDFAAGIGIWELSRKYFLSEKSIRRILQNQ